MCVIRLVWPRAGLQENLDRFHAFERNRSVQGCVALIVLRVDVSTMFE